jgi:thioesterase domain-containing protein
VSVAALLQELRDRKVEIRLDGDALKCSAGVGVLTPELRDELTQRKGEIIEFLRASESLAGQQRAIVPLQPSGTKTPIFAVPGHNGNVFSFRTLVQHLGADQPFYGLQPPGVEGETEPMTSVEELALYFAEQIRAFRPEGPYIIAGHCSGGTVAFEVASLLQWEGAEVEFVALFGSPYASAFRPLGQRLQKLEQLMKRVRIHVRALGSLPSVERGRYVAEIVRRLFEPSAVVDDGAAAEPVDAVRLKVQNATMVGVRRYSPVHFAGRVIVFLPSEEWRHSARNALGWLRVAREGKVYCGLDGCEGDTILLEPYAGRTAEQFRHACSVVAVGAERESAVQAPRGRRSRPGYAVG